jgi:hypothetical protein
MAKKRTSTIIEYFRSGPEAEVQVVYDLVRDTMRRRFRATKTNAAPKRPRKKAKVLASVSTTPEGAATTSNVPF